MAIALPLILGLVQDLPAAWKIFSDLKAGNSPQSTDVTALKQALDMSADEMNAAEKRVFGEQLGTDPANDLK